MREKQPTWISDPTGEGRFEAWVSQNKKMADVVDTKIDKKHTAMTRKQVAKLRLLVIEILESGVREFADMDREAMQEFVTLLEYLILDVMVE